MKRKIRRYETDQITVLYDLKRCIHAAECVKGLPEVFDPDRRPWIDPSQGEVTDIAEIVSRCPTGALHFEDPTGETTEAVPRPNRVQVAADGPLYLEGELEIVDAEQEPLSENRAALCRCGLSSSKPFCDNSHLDSFRDPGEVQEQNPSRPPAAADARLRIDFRPNGPMILSGPLRLQRQGSADFVELNKTALCRCGASERKPFCDGSHSRIGFQG